MALLEGIPNSVKAGASIIGAIAVVIGGYNSANSWAQSKQDELRQEMAVMEAKQAIIHDQQFQTTRAESNEAKLKIAELELAQLEDDLEYKESKGIEITQRELRARDRLIEAIKVFDEEAREARKNIRNSEGGQ